MSDHEPAEATPGYVPFDTFEGFIGTLKEVNIVPDHIDRAQMPKISGGMQSHLLVSLKFLKLIGPKGETQDSLHRLVKSYKTADWKAMLASVIVPAYAPIIGDLNIKSGVLKKLRERFHDATKLDGTTLDKALRFYLKALKAAGVEVSPHFFTRKPRTKRPGPNGRAGQEPHASVDGAQKAAKASGEKSDGGHKMEERIPPDLIEHPLYFKGKTAGCLRVPADLTEQDCKVIELTLAVLRAYAAQGKGDQNH